MRSRLVILLVAACYRDVQLTGDALDDATGLDAPSVPCFASSFGDAIGPGWALFGSGGSGSAQVVSGVLQVGLATGAEGDSFGLGLITPLSFNPGGSIEVEIVSAPTAVPEFDMIATTASGAKLDIGSYRGKLTSQFIDNSGLAGPIATLTTTSLPPYLRFVIDTTTTATIEWSPDHSTWFPQVMGAVPDGGGNPIGVALDVANMSDNDHGSVGLSNFAAYCAR